ncbi:cytochrome c oxidase assembly protein COX18, mitochondrial-like [Paramacrobiotus metropolitanus]|uniref:cytochrome c oxidase assembly protein COX18, mitochondrial-like n=1 Tax=Paramacrobiotus metropolitanus TaxID=2943436 RepID=UPI0024458801|nr:cytochrome c oxidase assembly protein COX18, mitochondrial-like [Paramacrobiotus metropolitanus]
MHAAWSILIRSPRTPFIRNTLLIAHHAFPPRTALPSPALRSARTYVTSTAWVDYMADSALVRGCEKILLTVHETCGTPWWATIIISVVALRSVVTVPLAVLQRRISAKVSSLKPQMDQIAREVAHGVSVQRRAKNWTEQQAASAFRKLMSVERREMWIKHNCHPAKGFLLPWFQIPLWIGLSFALRNLCGGWAHLEHQEARKDFADGGLLWFRDMNSRDRMYALPVIYGIMNLLLTELWVAGMPAKRSLPMKFVVWVARIASVFFVPIAATLPAAISYYWTMSSLFGIIQLLLFMNPRTMRTLRIPVIDKNPAPYRTMFRKLLRLPVPALPSGAAKSV